MGAYLDHHKKNFIHISAPSIEILASSLLLRVQKLSFDKTINIDKSMCFLFNDKADSFDINYYLTKVQM